MVCLSFVAVVAKTTPFVAWLLATILFVHKSCVYLLAMRFFLLILFARLFSFFLLLLVLVLLLPLQPRCSFFGFVFIFYFCCCCRSMRHSLECRLVGEGVWGGLCFYFIKLILAFFCCRWIIYSFGFFYDTLMGVVFLLFLSIFASAMIS